VIKYNICSNFYNAITKNILQYVLSISLSQEQKQVYITNIMNNINTKDNDLKKYMIQEMPLKLVKYILKIYDNEDDEINKIYDNIDIKQNIFNPIVEKITLMMNLVIPIKSDKSSLITNITTYLFSYYEFILKLVIEKQKMLLDNYNNYIANSQRYIEIMKILFEKTKIEQNK